MKKDKTNPFISIMNYFKYFAIFILVIITRIGLIMEIESKDSILVWFWAVSIVLLVFLVLYFFLSFRSKSILINISLLFLLIFLFSGIYTFVDISIYLFIIGLILQLLEVVGFTISIKVFFKGDLIKLNKKHKRKQKLYDKNKLKKQ